MSRFRKLSHTVWECKYHLVWIPKYRYRVLTDQVRRYTHNSIRELCRRRCVDVEELNVRPDHVHLLVMIPPKVSISQFLGRLKGQTSMRLFHQFRHLKKKPYWGNHFWAKGYCVDTVGLDTDMIRKYVRYQEKKERQLEQMQLID